MKKTTKMAGTRPKSGNELPAPKAFVPHPQANTRGFGIQALGAHTGMTSLQNKLPQDSVKNAELTSVVLAIPPRRRGVVLLSVASFHPTPTLEASFEIGPVRAVFAHYWESTFRRPIPIKELREVLAPPVPIKTVLKFSRFNSITDEAEISPALVNLMQYLESQVRKLEAPKQLNLFTQTDGIGKPEIVTQQRGSVDNLQQLIERDLKFRTIYADPPWPYQNKASRGAAINHYRTMSVDEICSEPVPKLAEENAHLHLWTTNGFLREALDVVDAWGFSFKSCLVWVKSEIGMGNYWRVSHEFLLLGVRGRLTFRDRTLPSWLQASRTTHSRKPGAVRELIEKASPPPYLELYGREEFPNSSWTVYGNQIERQLF